MTTEIPPAVPEEDWETVTDESPTQVELEPGESFLGIKAGERTAEMSDGKEVPVFLFRAYGAQGGDEGVEDGELCSMIGSFKLLGLKDVPDGKLCRITRMRDVPMTGGGRQPMKDYKVQSRNVPG